MNHCKTTSFVALIVTAVFALSACDKNSTKPGATTAKVITPGGKTMPAGHPPMGKGAAPKPGAAGGLSGVVAETMNAASYTYIKLKNATGEVWAAVPTAKVKVGDRVTIGRPALMKNFKSKTLKRTFASIYFGRLVKGPVSNAAAAAKVAVVHGTVAKKRAKVDVGKIAKADGGYTISELFARRKKLAGKKVKVRAKVTKFNANIMGKNWVHLQDGSGTASATDFDLTATTKAKAKIGEVVVVEGTLAADKNFGAGYVYGAIVENATVTVSK